MEIHVDNASDIGAQENEEDYDKGANHAIALARWSTTSQKGENGQETKNHNDNKEEAKKDCRRVAIL